MLVIENVSVHYGAIQALHGVSLRVDQGEIVALIGGNGAGKSTTLNAVSGILPLSGGSISFEGAAIQTLPPHRIVEQGICQVPEGRRVFGRMTVLENLEMGGYTNASRADRAAGIEQAFALFPLLKERMRQQARTLSGGEQQMLAMARALMSRPRLLLLDEPSMGLAPLLVEKIFEIIADIRAGGVTILLVEQNAAMALSIAQRGYVLETGAIILSGSADELARNPEVRRAYLGE